MGLQHVGIFGLGLLGSSLARALKAYTPSITVSGHDHRQSTIDRALTLGIIDTTTGFDQALLSTTDIIVLCTPLLSYPDYLKRLTPLLAPHTVITDVGSVKTCVMLWGREYLSPDQQLRFIPGHPIAGSHLKGLDAGQADLYVNKTILLTPTSFHDQQAITMTEELWKHAKALPKRLDAEQHDRIYAEVSHLNQASIYAYMVLLSQPLPESPLLNAFTRLGASPASMWSEIYTCNAIPLYESGQLFCHHLDNLIDLIQHDDWYGLDNILGQARVIRAKIYPSTLPESRDAVLPSSPLSSLLPLMIASCIVHTASHPEYAGSGFRDTTSILLTPEYVVPTGENKALTLSLLRRYTIVIKDFLLLIRNQDQQTLQKWIQEATKQHERFAPALAM